MTCDTNPITEAITAHWGERCDDTMDGCPCCEAWAAYDRLRGPEAPVQEPPSPGVTAGRRGDEDPLVTQLTGRARFLRDRGEIKTPGLLEHAAKALTPAPVVPAEGLDDLAGALARGYCAPENSHKELDADLINAMLREVAALRSAPPVGARVKPLAAVFDAAQAEAEKAMRKFPQPNYVISKVAEEAGEVVKAAIHCAENRETKEAVLGEVVQCMAMLIRLCLEGDQVHGLAALLPAGEGE